MVKHCKTLFVFFCIDYWIYVILLMMQHKSNVFYFFRKMKVWSLHLKNVSNSTFLDWKTKSPIFYCLKRKNVNSCEFKFAGGKFFVCMCFFETKYIFLYTFDLCGRVDDKKILIRPISGNKTTFFWPNLREAVV